MGLATYAAGGTLILDEVGETQWHRFSLDGFLDLGQVLLPGELEALRERANELASGEIGNEHVLIQHDADGGRLPYVKIEGLERDEVFHSLVTHLLFLDVCGRAYGPHAPISVFRAMVGNRRGGQTAQLPWHQDGGDAWHLDRDPLVTIWVALDDATVETGCVEAVRGSHRNGLLDTQDGALSQEDAEIYCNPDLSVPLEVRAGHALLMHSWLIRRSGTNRSVQPLRAFIGFYMDGRTIDVRTGEHFPVVAGMLDETPYPYLGHFARDRAALAESLRASQEREAGLVSEIDALRGRCETAEERARGLEAERANEKRRREEQAQHEQTQREQVQREQAEREQAQRAEAELAEGTRRRGWLRSLRH